MKKNKKNRSLILVAIFFILTSFTLIKLQEHKPTLFIIGDSTVRNGTTQIGNPLQGWGSFIGESFDTTRIAVRNNALGGTSSRTFISMGLWNKVIAKLQPGDFVIMQFGHNDSSPLNDNSRARGTIKGTGDETQVIDNLLTKKKDTVYSYGWYLRKYVTDAQSKGATAIICSPVPRNNWANGKVIRNDNDYGKWAKETAEKMKIGFVDLNNLIADRYDKLGADSVKHLFPSDNTHTGPTGAIINAQCVVEGLKAIKGCQLVKFLKK
ncbi:MAG: rhamnogalacturonan acetylesterase [Bacteroidota bacterium]|nr:rhamnogalacturonan acetylesterase [Bacteroidota bacterium]